MDSLLALIILVLPGISGYYIFRQLGPFELRQKSDYEKTTIGILLNLPGLLLCWSIYTLFKWHTTTFKDFEESILKFWHFLLYVTVSFGCAIGTVLLWDYVIRVKVLKYINNHRQEKSRAKSSDISPWETFHGSEGSGLMRIYPLGESSKFVLGEMNKAFIPGEIDKGILLTTTKELEAWNGWFPNPERTYVDTVTKTVFEYFPTSAWEEAKRRVAQYQEDSTSPETSPSSQEEMAEEGSS